MSDQPDTIALVSDLIHSGEEEVALMITDCRCPWGNVFDLMRWAGLEGLNGLMVEFGPWIVFIMIIFY